MNHALGSSVTGTVSVNICARCGSHNAADARFCTSCGDFLEWAEVPIQPPPTSAEPVEVTPEAPTPATRPRSVVGDALESVEQGQQLALARDRPDLARHLEVAQSQLSERTWPVAVVGEFKRGKSTLVNALLNTAICPVDADIVTAVPTLIRYGEQPSATAYAESAFQPTLSPDSSAGSQREEPIVGEPIGFDEIAGLVAESSSPRNRRKLRSVEVRLHRALLRDGLALVDTPGVGGLDSAHGVITLSALDMADGMLFVTDASQELTRPEVDFLLMAIERCPIAACVVTKTDLYPEWRRIVELDKEHLRQAGLDLEVIPVSSFLRLRAGRDSELMEESGFAQLVQFLTSRVEASSRSRLATAAAQEVSFVTGQLARQVEAERQVVVRPEEAERVVSALATTTQRTARLASGTATWRQALTDGIQDLIGDIEYDLLGRLKNVSRDVDAVIDQGDPKDTWAEIEVWLRRAVVAAAVANYDEMSRRTEDLVGDVAAGFDLEAGAPVEVARAVPTQALGEIVISTADTIVARTSRFSTSLLAARSAAFVPMLMFGVAGHLLGVMVAGPLGLVLGAGIGRKVIKDEQARQLMYRRQQAKASARRYLDEVQFIVVKDCRDTLKRTQRTLRDEFEGRALAIHRSSTIALTSAQGARDLRPAERSRRATELEGQEREIRALQLQVARIQATAKDRTDG